MAAHLIASQKHLVCLPPLRFTIVAATLLLAAAQSAPAARPRLHAITPYVWRQGEELEVDFRGDNLQTVHQLLDYQSGVTVHEWNAEDPKFARAKISVSEDCPLGRHAIRLVTKHGITDLRLAYVSQFIRVSEQEPNNSRNEAQPIPRQCSVIGRRDGRHDDWFRITAKKGERVSVELVGIRLGRSPFDAKLKVLCSAGQVIATSDDTELNKQDPFVSFTALANNTFDVCVASASGEGNTNYFYALHVGKFPRPSRVTPNGGVPGEPINATWHYPDGSKSSQTVTLPTADALLPHLENVASIYPDVSEKSETPKAAAFTSPTPVPMLLAAHPIASESEPNNTYPQATPFELPVSVRGQMNEPNDRDCFVFAATKGQKLAASVRARRGLRSKLDCDLSLRSLSDGKFISSNDDQPTGPDSFLQFDIPRDGKYLLIVRDKLDRGGDGFNYWLEVGPAKPTVVINVPETARNVAHTLTVPQGSRMALRVTAAKNLVNGPLRLDLRGLPNGLVGDGNILPANRPATALMVRADKDAPLGAAIVPLTGELTSEANPDKSYPAHLLQKQLLVSGRNNFYMYGYEDSRLAVAVVETAPFDIQIVQPQVPIVRRGSMNLKIVALRSEGFDAPINIRLLDNPPGISTTGSVTIPGDKDEVALATTANANAALGVSTITAIASATYKNIDYQLASPLVNLEVSEPIVAVTIPKGKVTRGDSVELTVGLECNQPFTGAATAELLGLPNGVTSEPLQFEHGETGLTFLLTATKEARLGRTSGLLCRVVITEKDEPIVHTLGSGQLRVDPVPAPVPTNGAPPTDASARHVLERLSVV